MNFTPRMERLSKIWGSLAVILAIAAVGYTVAAEVTEKSEQIEQMDEDLQKVEGIAIANASSLASIVRERELEAQKEALEEAHRAEKAELEEKIRMLEMAAEPE